MPKIANRRTGREGDLSQRRGHRRIDRVASLLECLKTGARGKGVVRDGDRPIDPHRSPGAHPLDSLLLHVLCIFARAPARGRKIDVRLATRLRRSAQSQYRH
jgi:hypothetical protein